MLIDRKVIPAGTGFSSSLRVMWIPRPVETVRVVLKPEEVFAAAKKGEDPRCVEFAILWHRALAAATASSIHMGGPGKFYISGPNARFVNLNFLNRCAQEMVKMSPLQGYAFEIVPKTDAIAVLGAVVNAIQTK